MSNTKKRKNFKHLKQEKTYSLLSMALVVSFVPFKVSLGLTSVAANRLFRRDFTRWSSTEIWP